VSVQLERAGLGLLRRAQVIRELIVQLCNEGVVRERVTGTYGAEGNGNTKHLYVFGSCREGPRASSAGEIVGKCG
jgi:hypothetical protein